MNEKEFIDKNNVEKYRDEQIYFNKYITITFKSTQKQEKNQHTDNEKKTKLYL